MKRLSFVIAIILSVSATTIAQNVDDALRYSQLFYGGTARFMGMGGAFTSIGGDISTLSQNPAGLGVFRSSEITLTPQLSNIMTDAGFYGKTTDNLYDFHLNQAGIVSNLISNESGLISLNIGYSFNKTNNLSQTIRIQGNNSNSSMADYWAESNDGIFYDDLADDSWAAFNAWVIDTITGSGGYSYGTVFSNYGDNPPSIYGQNVRRIITYDGYTAEHAISVGGNYNNKIFFGATLGISKLKFSSHFEHLESTDANLLSGFKNFVYTDHFEDSGTGFTLKMGAIIKPVETVRIGLAFHSPTWYRIDEYLYGNMSSNLANEVFDLEPLRFEYALATPFRALAGASVQIGKMGILSADYEFIDYSIARFSETGDNYDYSEKNLQIKNTLKAAHNLRFGGELRLNKLYLRGGYGYYGKAFQQGEENEDLAYTSISGGIGFREQRVSIDFGFTSYMYDQTYILYPLDLSYYNPANANLSINKNMFTLTLGYKFGY